MIEPFWFLLIHMGKFVAPPLPKPTDVNWQFNPSSWKDDETRVSPQHAVEVAKWPKNKLRETCGFSSWWQRVTPWAACLEWMRFFWTNLRLNIWESGYWTWIKIWSYLRAEWSGALRDGSQSHGTPDHLATFSMMPSVLKSGVILACWLCWERS